MDITNVSDKMCMDLLTEKIKPELHSLAFKVLLSRLILEIKSAKTTDVIIKCVRELKNFFTKNSNLPSLQNDLQKLERAIPYKLSEV